VSDAGYLIYPETLAIRPDKKTALTPCLKKLVPISQRSAVEYAADPRATNALIIHLIKDYGAFTYSPSRAATATSAMKQNGILGNGDNKAIGIDIAMSKRARPNITYRAASLLDVTPEQDDLFDVVLSVNTLFHLFREHDPDDVLRHVRSLLAPGGTAVIVDVVSVYSRSVLRHRWWGVEDTIRTLGRRRSASAAWTVLRLRQHPTWLRHVRINRTLTRDAFHQRYSSVFPGARFNDRLDPFLCGMHWLNTEPRNS
jgi:SAM-dependent methyltransferase